MRPGGHPDSRRSQLLHAPGAHINGFSWGPHDAPELSRLVDAVHPWTRQWTFVLRTTFRINELGAACSNQRRSKSGLSPSRLFRGCGAPKRHGDGLPHSCSEAGTTPGKKRMHCIVTCFHTRLRSPYPHACPHAQMLLHVRARANSMPPEILQACDSSFEHATRTMALHVGRAVLHLGNHETFAQGGENGPKRNTSAAEYAEARGVRSVALADRVGQSILARDAGLRISPAKECRALRHAQPCRE